MPADILPEIPGKTAQSFLSVPGYLQKDLIPLRLRGREAALLQLRVGTDEGEKTLRVGSWLNFDPVRIHQLFPGEKRRPVSHGRLQHRDILPCSRELLSH